MVKYVWLLLVLVELDFYIMVSYIEIVKLLCMIKNIYINMFYIILINNGLCEILYVFFGWF